MVKIWSLLRDKQISLKDLLFIPHMIFKYKGFRGPSAAGITLKSGTLKYRKTFCPETPALIQLHPRGNIVTFNIIPSVYTHTHTHITVYVFPYLASRLCPSICRQLTMDVALLPGMKTELCYRISSDSRN